MIEAAHKLRMTTIARRPIAICEGDDAQIPNRDVLPYKHIKTPGIDSHASVETVEDAASSQLFAHGLLRKYHGLYLEEIRQQFRNEATIMRRSPFLLHTITPYAAHSRFYKFDINLYLVVKSGDPASYLQTTLDSGSSPIVEKCIIFKRYHGCLVNGLAFIHSYSIQHRDIKLHKISLLTKAKPSLLILALVLMKFKIITLRKLSSLIILPHVIVPRKLRALLGI